MAFTSSYLVSAFMACFGSSLLYGYNIGVLNTPATILQAFYNRTYEDRGKPLTSFQLEWLWSATVSVFVLAGCIGAFSTSAVIEKFGRKKGLLFNHLFMFLGALAMGISMVAKCPELLIVGRFFVGINCGMTCGLSTIYLSEISTKSTRGGAVACHQLAVTIGIMIAQIMGLDKLLGTESLWPVLLALTALPALVSLVTLPWAFCPESPRYLFINKQQEDKARNALVRLRGTDDVTEELEEMAHEAQESKQKSKSDFKFFDLFRRRQLRLPLAIALVLQVAQQWSGINAVFFYAGFIFLDAGVHKDYVQYAIMGTGIINVITTIVSVPLLEKVGRRPLLLWPTLSMIIASVGLVISMNLQNSVSGMAILSIVLVHVFVVSFAIGLGPVPQAIVVEVFRQEARSAAASTAQGLNWACNFVLALSFRFLQLGVGAYVFVLFAVVLTLCFIFMLIYLPETKDKTFDEIARNLSMGSSVWRRKQTLVSQDDEAEKKLDSDTHV